MGSDHATILSLLPVEELDKAHLCRLLRVQSCTLIPSSDIKDRPKSEIPGHLAKIHRESGGGTFAIFCLDWDRQPNRAALYTMACLVPASRRVVVDLAGNLRLLTWTGLLFSEYPSAFSQFIAGQQLVGNVNEKISHELKTAWPRYGVARGSVNEIVYMKTDLWFGVKAGGSVGHVAGVINAFVKRGIEVDAISPEKLAMLDESVRSIVIPPSTFYTNVREHMLLYYNRQVAASGLKEVQNRSRDVVYARYSLDSYAPVIIARELEIPLILEYNGSEVWVAKHWGGGLRYRALAEKIEEFVIRSADMITVVSKPLMDDLVKRGIDENRILVNPNAVDPGMFDPGRFSPEEISELRDELGIPAGRIVAGFIGTFGQWHGVEVLASAIPLALEGNSNLHFLLIGGGPLLNRVRDHLRTSDVLDRVTITGIIPQRDAPKYLMCADFFLSPHVPNADGTPFFGSPTKLFEYMALGKGIIASDLDQIGEILEHEKTAILVKPGNSRDLAKAIDYMYDNMEFTNKLGKAARELVLEKYTWDAHVGKILDYLYDLK